jgi:hypothetical protein
VKKCLFAWSDWSIFPASFTEGLEAIFYLSEAEVKNMEEFITTQVEQTKQNNNSSSGGGGGDSSQEQQHHQQQLTMVESLRKKAKNSGVFLPRYEYASPFSSSSERERKDYWEMKYKLDFIERYFQRSKNPEQSLPQTKSGIIATEEEREREREEKQKQQQQKQTEEDIDLEGEPIRPSNEEEMDIDGEPIAMTVTVNRNKTNEENYDDLDGEPITENNHHDDLDGIPLEEPSRMTMTDNNEVSNTRGEQTGEGEVEEEEDLDGMPL